MAEKVGKMSFDEALDLNINGYTGLVPVNANMWIALLEDLATSLYTWDGNLDFLDRLLIEKFIHYRKIFCMVRPKYQQGTAIILGQYRIMECIPIAYGIRNIVTAVRLVCERPPRNLIMEYNYNEFVLFDNHTLTSPAMLVNKYAEMLGKLDALYMQNIDKMGVPIIAMGNKTMRNDLLNLFKRTKLNALFTLINENRSNKATEIFYDAKIEFILDKVNSERESIMREFLQELGVNPNGEVMKKSQYVNVPAVRESSLISKFFSASINKYRTNFVDKCNARYPDLNLGYHTTVKTYEELINNVGESIEI